MKSSWIISLRCYALNYNNVIGSNIGGLFLLGNNNTIVGNAISNNEFYGICLVYSHNNKINHNNIVNNTENGYDGYGTGNVWDNGYPSGGNYWSDYTGNDTNRDGIGEDPYNIPGGDGVDRYPLMEPWSESCTLEKKMLNVPFFSQRDPAWKDKLLDHSSYSIGDYGCALTSVAMVSKYFGFDADPDRLNTSLTEVGGLDRYGLLHWEKVGTVTCGRI